MVPPVDIRINHVAAVNSLLRAEHRVYKGALLLEVEGNLFVGYLTMGDHLRRLNLRRLLLLLRTAYVIPVLDLVRVLVRVLSYQRCRPYLKQQKQHKAVPKRNTPTVGIVMVKVFKLGSIIPASHSNTNTEACVLQAWRKEDFFGPKVQNRVKVQPRRIRSRRFFGAEVGEGLQINFIMWRNTGLVSAWIVLSILRKKLA